MWMNVLRHVGVFFKRLGFLLRAVPWAVVLGLMEVLRSERGRRVLASMALCGLCAALVFARPLRPVAPGEVAVRYNRVTGGLTLMPEGLALLLPGLHELRFYSLREQIYNPKKGASARGESPYKSVEGLSIGVEVTVRYALDPERVLQVARRLPGALADQLVEPMVDGVLHRTLSRHTVREIFSTRRAEIQQGVADELRGLLQPDGVMVRSVYLGSVDLPPEYRAGLEGLLSEELRAEKMRYTLELKEKQVKEAELQAEAQKIQREKAAEAAGREEIIAAKAKAEAMQHVLPFKQKEIEQKRLEAEAQKVQRLKQAEGEAEARRIDAGGEADARRKLAEADAYRLEVTGKAQTAQLARESDLIAKNPLLIQKTMADKLGDKVQVIIAPPQAGGFIAGGLIGQGQARPAGSKVAQAKVPANDAAEEE